MAVITASDNEFPKVIFVEGAAPGTPPAGMVYAYAKGDGLLYQKDDAGVETVLGGDVAVHLADATDAHDASAISIVDAGALITATDVEGALAELAAASGGGDLDDLGDVNAPTPADQDVLTWDAGGSEWVAQAAPGGGGGVTTGYVGYNAIGGTVAAFATGSYVLKPFTPATDIVLLSVEVYCKLNSDGVNPNIYGGVLLDSGGSPREAVRFAEGDPLLDAINGAGGLNPRWLGIPIAPVFLPAGTQAWLQAGYNAGGNWVDFYRDGSGADRTSAASGLFGDAGFFTVTTTTDRYSIRGLYLEA